MVTEGSVVGEECKRSSAASIGGPVVDDENVTSWVIFRASCFIQCVDMVDWHAGRVSGPVQTSSTCPPYTVGSLVE